MPAKGRGKPADRTEATEIVLRIASDNTREFEAMFEAEEIPIWEDFTRRGRFVECRLVRIQGGDPEGTGMGGPGYSIKDELPAGNANVRGSISMANAGPNTGGSQFFINVVDNRRLDPKHPVFGRVVGGMDVADAISRTPRDGDDRPRTKVTIRKASMIS